MLFELCVEFFREKPETISQRVRRPGGHQHAGDVCGLAALEDHDALIHGDFPQVATIQGFLEEKTDSLQHPGEEALIKSVLAGSPRVGKYRYATARIDDHQT